MPADPAAVKALFLEAAALDDPVARASLLNERCREDAALLARVNALLAANDRAVANQGTASFGSEAEPTADFPGKDECVGAILGGRYKLVEEIGEGGMGQVFLAQQTEPVKRAVAVKVIKAGMDSKQVLTRFEAERQALAMMDHPNIAKVLDAGTTESGRPFFVMELVKGTPITQFCDERKLTPKQRLELFVPVCQAIQHAHQKGIIHRDIKPSNVLIALYDDKPVVKVIDFGVAKATGAALTERTIDTGFGGVVGTPQYMSPEQATFNNLDIDTRSDVYALGVLLYELLTGSPPFTSKELKQEGLLEILRVVREEEPPRPSTKLSTADALASLSANRGTEPKKLTGLLRNELDWIVMKALEKDRARRYETANGFADDVQRYLTGEAVQAHPPSASYRLRKFVRRNRVAVFLTLFVAASLVAVVLNRFLASEEVRAERDRALAAADRERIAKRDADAKGKEAQKEKTMALAASDAERRAKLEAVAQTEKAQKRLRQIEKANDLLGSIFENLDPKVIARTERPLQAILVEKLDQAVAQLEGESIGDPLVVAGMQNKFGLSLLGLGEPGKAIVLLEKARATHQARLGADHPDTLTSMNNLADAYWGAGKWNQALPLYEETLKLRKARLGREHPHTLSSMNNLALAYLATGKQDLALPLFEETLKLRKAKFGPDHPDTLNSMNSLAEAYRDAGKKDLALPLFEETLKLMKVRLGREHPHTLSSMNNLGVAWYDAGKLDMALTYLKETLKLRKARLGADHPDTLNSMNNLAATYLAAGKQNLALPLHEETLKLRKAKLGADHPDTLISMNNLGVAYCDANQGEKAAATLKEFVAGWRKQANPDDTPFAGLLAQVALDLSKCRQYTAVEEFLRECLAIREKKEPDAWTTFNTKSLLGGALLGQKKYADAEPLLLKGYEGLKAREKSIPPQGSIRIPEAIDRLIDHYSATGKPNEAAKWRAERAKYPEVAPQSRQKK